MGIKITEADRWFSKALRESRGNNCENCGASGLVKKMECCHIYGRANKSTRWDTANCVCMCHTCHRHYTENPLLFHDWLTQHLGSGMLELLLEKKNRIFKTNKAIRADIAKYYREEYKLLVADPDHVLVSYQ